MALLNQINFIYKSLKQLKLAKVRNPTITATLE